MGRFNIKRLLAIGCGGFVIMNIMFGYYTMQSGYVSPDLGRVAVFVYYSLESWVGLTFSWNVPTYTENQKWKIFHNTIGTTWHNHSGCDIVDDGFMLIAMRTPKAASTTLEELVSKLSRKNKYVVNHVTYLTLDKRERVSSDAYSDRAKAFCEYFGSMGKRVVHVAHLRFLNFEQFHFPQPLYVGTIRDPVLRMQSSYNYDYFADRPIHVEHVGDDKKSKIRTQDTPTFVDCVRAHMRGTAPISYACLRPVYSNTQLRYYCGMNDIKCRGAHSDSDASLQVVYDMALHNMNRGFRVVIVVERMEQSIALLEKTLPTFFRGAMKIYNSSEEGMRSNVNTKLPPPGSLRKGSGHPTPASTFTSTSGGNNVTEIPLDRGIPVDVREFLEKGLLRYEMLLYADAVKHLEHNLQECHL